MIGPHFHNFVPITETNYLKHFSFTKTLSHNSLASCILVIGLQVASFCIAIPFVHQLQLLHLLEGLPQRVYHLWLPW